MRNRIAIPARRSQLAVVAVALLACDSPKAGVAHADTSRTTAPDTIVRRVLRVTRVPSLMERVTGVVTAFNAMQPLDSALAIRVRDQRGLAARNVGVDWTVLSAGDGARLRIINARTDSLGVSRAAFTPGRTALPQTIAADVDRIGRIRFDVNVPVASIRLETESRSLWSGDASTVTADLRDAGGTILSGGPLVWGSTDSSILAITAADARRATVLGKLAGSAEVVAWIEPGTMRGTARLAVKPEVSGLFVTLDGTRPPRMRLGVRTGALQDSVPVVDGRFAKRIELPSGDVELHATPEDAATHHAARIRVTQYRLLQNIRIALVPTSWRVEGGTYDGRDVPIDARLALQRSARGAAFWRLAPITGTAPTQLLGWPESSFPLRIAFNRGRSRESIQADDSTEFWRIAEQMQRDLGARVFAPAQLHGDTIPSGVVTVEIANDAAQGHTFVTWNEGGDAFDGVLTFQHASTLRSSHVVTHELLHLLGFGHATSFRSVSRSGSSEPRLTVEDVAHAQLAMRLRRLQRQTGARPGLPLITP